MTETRTLTVTEFLLARIAEDEEKGRWVDGQTTDRRLEWDVLTYDIESSPCITVGTARWLAECAAKRRIVEMHRLTSVPLSHPNAMLDAEAAAFEFAAHQLASVYADHPDFRPEWRA